MTHGIHTTEELNIMAQTLHAYAGFARAFKADRAWRTWNRTNPSIHVAYYEFETAALALAVPQSADIKPLIAEFDAAWGGRVTRTREIEEVVQRLPIISGSLAG